MDIIQDDCHYDIVLSSRMVAMQKKRQNKVTARHVQLTTVSEIVNSL